MLNLTNSNTLGDSKSQFPLTNYLSTLSISLMQKPLLVRKKFNNQVFSGKLFEGDALDFLNKLESNSAQIVFLDPPFNLGKRYSRIERISDNLPDDVYRDWLMTVLEESSRVLKPGGALFFYHLPKWAMRAAVYLEEFLDFRHWIAISMKNGFVRGNRLYPAHYALLMFSKGELKHFKRPKISPQKCRHCGKLVKDYGGYKAIIKKKGLNLSDIWEDLSPVRHASKKYRGPNELPPRLFERILGMSGKKGGTYVDPFAGAGSGVVAAASKQMKVLACDLLEENCSIIAKRLMELKR